MVNLLFLRSYRTASLAFTLLGVIILLTAFYPVWIFKMALVARVLLGMTFPQFFAPTIHTVSLITYI